MVGTSRGAPRTLPYPEPALLGREPELRTLQDALRGGTDRGLALAFSGDAGIGKSALLSAGAGLARTQGWTVLYAVGIENEWGLPYAGLQRLLQPTAADYAALPPPQSRALAAAFGLDTTEAPQPFLVSLASLTLLRLAGSSAPVLLCVDDVHWLDEPTQDALAFIARRVANEPIVVFGSLRHGHTSVVVEACTHQIEVKGLDTADARELLTRHAPDLAPRVQDHILAHALGNPLAIVELPTARRAMATMTGESSAESVPLSTRLENAFADRFDELTTSARDALLLAATDGQCDLSEILAAAAVLSKQPVDLDAVESAALAGLVSVERRGLTFRHPLIRSAVLQAETMGRRRAAHHALAEVLSADRYRRIWHRGEATIGADDALAEELEQIHVVALQRGSALTAIAILERSAALTADSARRGRRLLLAAEHAFGLGRAEMVDRLLAEAQRHQLSELEQARMEWLREIFKDGVPGDARRVAELCHTAEQSGIAGDNGLALNLLLGASLRCWWADTGPQARRLVVDTLRGLTNAAGDARYVAVLAIAEPVLECAAVERILAGVVADSIVDPADLRFYGWAAHAVGDLVRAVSFFDRAESIFREQGRLGLLSHVLTMSAVDRLQLGEWQQPLLALAESQQIARDTGQPIWDVGSLSVTAIALGLRGDPTAHEKAALAETIAKKSRLSVMLTCVQLARGYAFAGARDYPQAYSALSRLFLAILPIRCGTRGKHSPGSWCSPKPQRIRGGSTMREPCSPTWSGGPRSARHLSCTTSCATPAQCWRMTTTQRSCSERPGVPIWCAGRGRRRDFNWPTVPSCGATTGRANRGRSCGRLRSRSRSSVPVRGPSRQVWSYAPPESTPSPPRTPPQKISSRRRNCRSPIWLRTA